MKKGKNHAEQKSGWPQIQERLFRMVSVGVVDEFVNQCYDVVSTGALVLNLTASILDTFQGIHEKFGLLFTAVELVTVLIFAVDYILRILTARCQYPDVSEPKAVSKYMLSFMGIVDLFSFLPYCLPVFFPSGAVVFRMFRVVRILRLFRINAYYDSLNVITEVLADKKQQLLSSVFIILVLMVGASLCMYSLENKAQPDIFQNAFSGIWWAASTLLTVGYGDIYPITTGGKAFGIVISFLGVGMVAIPTGIISAGFVEQYSRFKRLAEYGEEHNMDFVRVRLDGKDSWTGKAVKDLDLPRNMVTALILRDEQAVTVRGDVMLKPGDVLVLGTPEDKTEIPLTLREIKLGREHPWNGQVVGDLDIPRQTSLIRVCRGSRSFIPRDDLILREGDEILVYKKGKKSDLSENQKQI